MAEEARRLLPVLRRFEERRRRIWRRLGQVLLVAAGLAALAAGLTAAGVLPDPERIAPAYFVAGGVVLLALVITWAAMAAPYRRAFKQEVITAIVDMVAPQLRYSPDGGIAQGDFVACQIFARRPDRYRSEDLIAGAVGATAIEAAEIHAQYKTRSRKGQTQWHTLFRGLMFIGDFHKHFHGHTLVVPDRTQRFLGGLAQWLQSLDFTRPGELVKLENPEFERRFCVYSDDQVEARYILSPSLMRRLLALAERTGSAISVAFHDSRVFVAIPRTRDMFEAPLLRSVMDSATVREYCEDVREAVQMVEELNLNTRIWTKR